MPEPHAQPVKVADRQDDGRRRRHQAQPGGPHRPLKHAKEPEETQGADPGGVPEPVPCGATLFSLSRFWGAVQVGIPFYLINQLLLRVYS